MGLNARERVCSAAGLSDTVFLHRRETFVDVLQHGLQLRFQFAIPAEAERVTKNGELALDILAGAQQFFARRGCFIVRRGHAGFSKARRPFALSA